MSRSITYFGTLNSFLFSAKKKRFRLFVGIFLCCFDFYVVTSEWRLLSALAALLAPARHPTTYGAVNAQPDVTNGPYAPLIKELLLRYHNAVCLVLGLNKTKSVMPSLLKSAAPTNVHRARKVGP